MRQRPERSDEAVILAAAEKLWPVVKRWLIDSENMDGTGDEKIMDEYKRDLSMAIGKYDDGYKIARQLDRCGWDPDYGLVRIMLKARDAVDGAFIDAIASWVNEVGLQNIPVGATVRVKSRERKRAGTVTHTTETNATATVQFDDGVVDILGWEMLEIWPPITFDNEVVVNPSLVIPGQVVMATI